MSNMRTLTKTTISDNKGALASDIPETTMWRDFLALIKVGIVNSNLITAFTGFWLALQVLDKGFFANLNILFYTIAGSAFIMAGSCALNNYIDRDIDHLMERTKARPTVTGKVKPISVALMGTGLILIGLIFLLLTTHDSIRDWYHWCFQLCSCLFHVVKAPSCFKHNSWKCIGSSSPLIGWEPSIQILI